MIRAHCDSRRRPVAAIAAGFVLGLACLSPAPAGAEPLSLRLRSQVETPGAAANGGYQTVEKSANWDPKATAIIVCDMWDLHHSRNAVLRLKEMAPRMDLLLKNARARGVLIIHAPSSCMETYKDHPARKRALAVPISRNLPPDIGKWCYQIPAEAKGTYPIDQAKGENDDEPNAQKQWLAQLAAMGREPGHPWKSETDLLTIDSDADVISDNGEEIWSILENRGIGHVILTGVHTNMCVLGRPFGLRQMAKNGKDVVLLRDLTDTMYNPERAPYVNHFAGTDLIIAHVEKYVCPTITSDQFLGGSPFRFEGDQRASASASGTAMTVRGKLLFQDSPDQPLAHDWAVNKGTWERVDGAIRGSELAADKHAAVAVHRFAMRNVVIQYALKLDGARGTALIFNDAKGHICRVQITPQLLTVRKDDHDRDGPDQGAILQALKTPVAPGTWHTVLVEIQGSEMLARIDGTAVAYGSHNGIDQDKTILGLVVLGASASFKDLSVWEALPNPEWAATRAKLVRTTDR
jgi:nicotinamidase-related amidase